MNNLHKILKEYAEDGRDSHIVISTYVGKDSISDTMIWKNSKLFNAILYPNWIQRLVIKIFF